MRKIIIAILVVSALGLAGCAGKTITGASGQQTSTVPATVSTALTQAAGVMQAIATLPPAPVDDATQKQLAGWKAWAAYLAPLVGVAAKAVISGL
jgi:predicted small secreted protein